MRTVLSPRLALLSIAHFSIDAYQSFFLPLIPLLVTKLDLSLTQVGMLVAFASITSSLAQPLFGWLSDRVQRPWFVAFGPLVGAVFLSAVGAAPSFLILAVLVLVGGLGAGAFHPQAAVLATSLTKKRTLSFSVFVVGGTMGFALGPLYAVWVATTFGLERTWLASVPGLVVAAVMLAWFARVQPMAAHEGAKPAWSELRPVLRPLALLYLVVVFRSAVAFGFMTFIPIYLHQNGFAVTAGGAALTVYVTAGALGSFVGSWMAERIGVRRILSLTFLGAIPLFFGMLFLDPGPGIACVVVGNFVLQGSLPLVVVMGQELSPRHRSTISSLMMGGAWGLGVLFVGPIGALADVVGLNTALLSLAGFLFAGLACALALPDLWKRQSPARVAQPAVG